MKKNNIHIPVFSEELIQLLEVKPGGVYADLTLGSGGHSRKILKLLDKNGKLLSIDVDKDAVKEAPEEDYPNWIVKQGNFQDIINISKESDLHKFDGIIADLGWSSDQLDSIEGLSYSNEESKLDMRFDKNLGVTASDLLNGFGRSELKKMFGLYADIYGKNALILVEEITKRRRLKKIETVGELNEIVLSVLPSRNSPASFLSKVYQALRIAVNGEYDALKNVLDDGFKLLKKNGNFLVITFHSGEEKLVKEWISVHRNQLELLTETNQGLQYWQPKLSELERNIRSRSAKIWAIKKVSGKKNEDIY